MNLLLSLASPALALDPQWSVGGQIGTHVLPVASPIAFPAKVQSYDFDEDAESLPDDVSGDGILDASTLQKVSADLLLAADASFWVTGGSRLVLLGDLDVGRRYRAFGLYGLYHRTIDLGAAYALLGGGAGYRNAVWYGEDSDEILKVPCYPVRVEGGLMLLVSDFLGIEAEAFLDIPIPLRHTYRDIAGQERDISGIPFSMTAVGLRVGATYGQLR